MKLNLFVLATFVTLGLYLSLGPWKLWKKVGSVSTGELSLFWLIINLLIINVFVIFLFLTYWQYAVGKSSGEIVENLLRSSDEKSELVKELAYQKSVNEMLASSREVSPQEIEFVTVLLSGKSEDIEKKLQDTQDSELRNKYFRFLEERLLDLRSPMRSAAINAISKFDNIEVTEILIKHLKDKDSEIRFYATNALFFIRDPAAVKPLLENLKDDKVRQITIGALAEIRDSRAVEPLLDLLGDKKNEREVIVALGKIGDMRAVDPLIRLLSSTDTREKKLTILLSLGRLRNEASVGCLKAYVRDKDIDIRKRAIESLGYPLRGLRDAAGLEAISAFILEETRQGQLRKMTSMLQQKDIFLRKFAINELGKRADPGVVEILLRSLTDADNALRVAAIRALVTSMATRGDVRGVKAIEALLNDKDKHVKTEAIIAIGRLGYVGANNQLISLLTDPAYREAAAEALKQNYASIDKDAIDNLLRRNSAADMKSVALGILGASGAELSGNRIVKFVEDDYSVVSKAIIGNLAAIIEGQDVDELLRALAGNDKMKRMCAILAASGFKSDKVVESLTTLLDDKDPVIVSMAAYSLGRTESKLALMGLAKRVEKQRELLKVIFNNSIGCILLSGDKADQEKAKVFLDKALSIHERVSRRYASSAYIGITGLEVGLVIPAKIYYDAARFYEKQNKMAEAEKMYLKGVRSALLLNIMALHKFRYGMFLYHRGRKGEAENMFKEAWPYLYRRERESVISVSSLRFINSTSQLTGFGDVVHKEI